MSPDAPLALILIPSPILPQDDIIFSSDSSISYLETRKRQNFKKIWVNFDIEIFTQNFMSPCLTTRCWHPGETYLRNSYCVNRFPQVFFVDFFFNERIENYLFLFRGTHFPHQVSSTCSMLLDRPLRLWSTFCQTTTSLYLLSFFVHWQRFWRIISQTITSLSLISAHSFLHSHKDFEGSCGRLGTKFASRENLEEPAVRETLWTGKYWQFFHIPFLFFCVCVCLFVPFRDWFFVYFFQVDWAPKEARTGWTPIPLIRADHRPGNSLRPLHHHHLHNHHPHDHHHRPGNPLRHHYHHLHHHQGGRCWGTAQPAVHERSGSSTKGRTPNIRYFVAKLSIVA